MYIPISGRIEDPGPEGPALVQPEGVIWIITFTSSVPPADQQPKSTRWIGVVHKMDFLSPVSAFSGTAISVRDSGFDFFSYETSF